MWIFFGNYDASFFVPVNLTVLEKKGPKVSKYIVALL